MSGDGAAAPCGDADWLPLYDRVLSMLKQVEELATERARLETTVQVQNKFLRSGEHVLDTTVKQMESTRGRWEMAYGDLLKLHGDIRDHRLPELKERDIEDCRSWESMVNAEDDMLEVEMKKIESYAEISQQNIESHEHVIKDLREEIEKLKQAYEALISNKEKEVSAVLAEKDFALDQYRIMEENNAVLLENKKKDAAYARMLQRDIEDMQKGAQKKYGEISKVQAQLGAARDKIKEMKSLTKEENKEYEKYRTKMAKEVSALTAEKDFVWAQLKDTQTLFQSLKVQAAEATQAAKKLQRNVVELQAAAQKKDDEIGRLQAEVVGTRNELQKMCTLANEKDIFFEKYRTEKDKDVSALIAQKDLVRNQLRILEEDKGVLVKNKEVDAAQKLQKIVEELKVTGQKKDAEIARLQAEVVDAKKKLQEMYSLVKETDENIGKYRAEKDKDVPAVVAEKFFGWNQSRTSAKDNHTPFNKEVEAAQPIRAAPKLQMYKKDTNKGHAKSSCNAPALIRKARNNSPGQMAGDGHETILERKCAFSFSNNGNDEEIRSNQVPKLLGKMGSRKRKVVQEENKAEHGVDGASTNEEIQNKVKKPKLNADTAQDNGSNASVIDWHSTEWNYRSRPESPTIIDYPEPEFFDFTNLASFAKFKKGQIWALYCDTDSFPKYYGFVKRVDPDNCTVRIRWLDYCPFVETEKLLVQEGLPVSCGIFKVSSQSEIYGCTSVFSHIMEVATIREGKKYEILPRVGQVWAIYKNWSCGWNFENYKRCDYVFVEVLEICGGSITVSYLTKVEGCSTVFMPESKGESISTVKIPRSDIMMFSHHIPSYRLKTENAKLCGYWELHPASVPDNLLVRKSE